MSLLNFGEFLLESTLSSGSDKFTIIARDARYGLEDQKTGEVVQSGKLQVFERRTIGSRTELQKEQLRFSAVTTLTPLNGLSRYEVTVALASDGVTRMRGLANSDDGDLSTTNVIDANIVGTFPANSFVNMNVSIDDFNSLKDLVEGSASELEGTSGTPINRFQPIQRDATGNLVPFVGGTAIGVSMTTVASAGEGVEYWTTVNASITGLTGFTGVGNLKAYADWDGTNPLSASIKAQNDVTLTAAAEFIGYFIDDTEIITSPVEQTLPTTASTTDAVNGTNNTRMMTPLTTSVAIANAFLNNVSSFDINIDNRAIQGLPRVLTWTAIAGATGYEVFRNGVSIGTTTNLTFTDSDTSAVPVNYEYQVRAALENNQKGSSFVYADVGLSDFFGYYGDGSDGSFTGGALTGGVHNFTDLNLTSNMVIDGSIVLVQGDFNTNGFDIISSFSDGSSSVSVLYNGTQYDLEQSALTIASGGTTGSVEKGGDAAPNRSSAGEDGDDGRQGGGVIVVGTGGIGGIAPAPTLYPGQDGQDGLPGPSVAGASGGGGSHGWGHTPSMFLIGGNYNNSGSNIIGVGADGGDGGNGLSANNFGGAGGGGGQGGDGLTLYLHVAGTNTNTASLNLINGVGGAFGLGGNGITPGTNGQAGLDGVNGSIITL